MGCEQLQAQGISDTMDGCRNRAIDQGKVSEMRIKGKERVSYHIAVRL
jgi:hypothetical protein